MRDILEVYERLIGEEALSGNHVSIDRDHRGEECIQIAPDWIDGTGLALVVGLAREYELALALTKDGLRLETHTSGTVAGVSAVKEALRGDGEAEEEED